MMYFNPYEIPAIITAILCILIGTYVFYKNPNNIQNKVFVLFILFVVAFSLGEAIARSSTSVEEGLLGGRIAYLGVIFMHIAALHFSYVFPKNRIKIEKNRYILFGFYIIAIFLLIFFNLIFSVEDVHLGEWGYRVSLGSKFYFIGIWSSGLILLVILNFFTSYKQSKTIIERKQVRYVLFGALIAGLPALGTNIIPSLLDIEVFPLGTVGLLLLSLFIGSAILQYNLFSFKPMVKPCLEEKIESRPKRYVLDTNKSYIIFEEGGEQGYEIFCDQIVHGLSGLCITKYAPQSIREKYGFKKTPILWFTFKYSEKENTINPTKTNIELILQIKGFVSKGSQTIVYVDCLDQIFLPLGFEHLIKLIQDIKILCSENQSILLLSVNPGIFEEKQLSVLADGFSEVE